jgi:hypothetical protein
MIRDVLAAGNRDTMERRRVHGTHANDGSGRQARRSRPTGRRHDRQDAVRTVNHSSVEL